MQLLLLATSSAKPLPALTLEQHPAFQPKPLPILLPKAHSLIEEAFAPLIDAVKKCIQIAGNALAGSNKRQEKFNANRRSEALSKLKRQLKGKIPRQSTVAKWLKEAGNCYITFMERVDTHIHYWAQRGFAKDNTEL